jgi:hypothetical protein
MLSSRCSFFVERARYRGLEGVTSDASAARRPGAEAKIDDAEQ